MSNASHRKPEAPPLAYSAASAARAVHRSPSWIAPAIRSGNLRSFKRDGARVILARDLEAYITTDTNTKDTP